MIQHDPTDDPWNSLRFAWAQLPPTTTVVCQGYALGIFLAGSLPALAVIPATMQIVRKV